MRKVLVIGGKGSIGSRYCAILKYFNVDYDIDDLDTPTLSVAILENRIEETWSHIIIATPTFTHIYFLDFLKNFKINILCEKPMCLNINKLNELKGSIATINMVCNWIFLPGVIDRKGVNAIYYNYYYPGKESFVENFAQPLYLGDKNIILKTYSLIHQCIINEKTIRVEHFQRSYLEMLSSWFSGIRKLWGIEEAIEMSEALNEANEVCIVLKAFGDKKNEKK